MNVSTGNPIENALIISSATFKEGLTNTFGRAQLPFSSKSQYIIVRATGFSPQKLSIDQLRSINFIVRLEPSDVELVEVVVSGSKWTQLSDNIPFKVTSLSQEDMLFHQPQTAADHLATTGEVFIQKSQLGGGSPMIRGFSTNRLLYSIDGVRMNNAIFRSGNLQNVISLDAFAIESTEVLFGPRSIIYGSDAIGGVMNFTTLTPTYHDDKKNAWHVNSTLRHSSANNERTGHIDITFSGQKWATATSLTVSDYDDLKQGSKGPEDYLKPFYVARINGKDSVVQQDDPLMQLPSGYSQINIMQKVRYSPGNNWDLQYGFHYSNTSQYGRYDRHNRMRDGLPRYGEWNYGPQKWIMNHLEANHISPKKLYDKISIRLAHQRFGESRISRSLNNITREIRRERVDAYSLNLDFSKYLNNNGALYYGVEHVYDHVNSQGFDQDIETGSSILGASRYPKSDWHSIAAFVSTEHPIGQAITMQGGIRYNRYLLTAAFDTTFYNFPFKSATIDHGALTGNIGLVYASGKHTSFRTNLATAFRSPNVDDMGKVFDSEPGAVVVPNPSLRSEYAYNLEIGTTTQIGEAIKFDAAVYYTLLENAMVRRDYQLDGQDSILYDGTMSKVQAIQNAAFAKVYGFQLSMDVELPLHLNVSTRLNHQRGTEELDEGNVSPSRHAPPFFGRSAISYGHNKVNIELMAIYQGQRNFEDLAIGEQTKDEIYAKDENGNNYSPSWYTINLKGTYAVSKNLLLTIGLENITDQRYRPYSAGISGPGRNFLVALNFHL
ncbi:TonB-dependent receptor plug domain-containing protein [Echinicola strongylocentroti]|uniref:TonB-dependent receptor plug domain-containing protein n=1 Tax=Echinicola strongylocentroti TaxID=1795355 RepID=UPI001FEB1F59|nr:TonB-dependent receptor [Echinicola strongylocentroti]